MDLLTHSDLAEVYDPVLISERKMNELVIYYLLENFEFEDEDHLLYVFEDLTEDEYFGILEEVEHLY